MLRTRAVEVSLWEAVLPEEVLRLPEELARVDALLDDPVFFAPFVPFFDPRLGRPSTPMEVYLRLMFLTFRYRLGYETLSREVTDSITWRRFCRIPLDGSVPHPTTLMKLTTRCGTAAVDGCNEALLAKAAEAKLLRTFRLRADTTVVPAVVAYPTDSGLLAKAVRRIAVTGRRIQAAGGATRTRLRDRSRSAGKRAHGIAAKLRLRRAQGREEAQHTVQRITGELAGLAERAATDAQRLLANARRALRRAQAKAEQLTAAGARDAAAGRRRGSSPRSAAPSGERPDQAAGGDPADRRADPPAGRRDRAGRGDPTGQSARRRRPADRQGPPREAGRVRLQGPGRRQRRRGRARPRTRAGQPSRCPAARSRARAGDPPHRPPSPDRHRRPRLRPGPRRRRPARPRGTHRRHPPQRQTRQGPPSPRTSTGVPAHREVADRQRRQDQRPQTRLRLGPHPTGQHRRSKDLDRTRDPGPQPRQDRSSGQLIKSPTGDQPEHAEPPLALAHRPGTISGRSS